MRTLSSKRRLDVSIVPLCGKIGSARAPCLRVTRLHASNHPPDDGRLWMPADGTIEMRLWMHAGQMAEMRIKG
jgi:hypothetical protein